MDPFVIFIVIVGLVISLAKKGTAGKGKQSGRTGAPSPWQGIPYSGGTANPGQQPGTSTMQTGSRKPFFDSTASDAPHDADSAPQGVYEPDSLSGQMTIMEMDAANRAGCDDGYGSLEHTTHEGEEFHSPYEHSDLAPGWQPAPGSMDEPAVTGDGSGESMTERIARQEKLKADIRARRTGNMRTANAGPGSLANRPLMESRLENSAAGRAPVAEPATAVSGGDEAMPELLGEKLDAQAMRRAVIFSEILNKRGGRHGWVRS